MPTPARTPTRTVAAAPGTGRRPDLRELMAVLRDAREEAQRMRLLPTGHDQLRAAQADLFRAMQNYSDELTARRLPIPPQLRDDLRIIGRSLTRGR